jgi:outer membrane protein OmpU
MKSILFASTALVAFAGAAAAQGVTLTGNAEMGIFGGDDVDAQFFTDIDVTFTMAGETDGGLTFGASIDLDESDGSNVGESSAPTVVDPGPDGIEGTADDEVVFNVPGSSGASPAFAADLQGGETIFLSGAFGTLTMGDTDGALDWALTEVAFNSGSLADDETEHAGYNGNSGLDGTFDGQILRYDYSFGDFGVALSAEVADERDDDDIDELSDIDDDAVIGIGFRYGLDLGGSNVDFGLGYQSTGDLDAVGVSVSGTFLGASVGISYLAADNDDGVDTRDDYDHFGIGAGYTTGAIALSANYGIYDYDNGDEDQGVGLSAGYDLGGGAIVQFGYGYSDAEVGGSSADTDTYSFGVRMNF